MKFIVTVIFIIMCLNTVKAQSDNSINYNQSKINLNFKTSINSHGSKPNGCPPRWCGCWLTMHLGISDRNLWLARNWAYKGRATDRRPGAIAVWRNHVGIIKGVEGNKVLLLSGNDGHAVRTRWRSIKGIIAYRTF